MEKSNMLKAIALVTGGFIAGFCVATKLATPDDIYKQNLNEILGCSDFCDLCRECEKEHSKEAQESI